MSDRLTRLRARLAEAGLDALLVSSPQNRRYVSGFTGSTGTPLVTWDAAIIATDFRYWEQAGSECPQWTLFKQDGPLAEWLPALLESAGLGGRKVGFEAATVPVTTHKQMRDAIAAMPAPNRPALVQTEGMVEELRAIKDADEIAALERAVLLGDAAFGHVAETMEPGWAETTVAWEIERYIREHGGEGLSFPTIVGGGPWGALPHAHPRDVPIAAGQPIVIDMGVLLDGYCSDLTRTVVLGEPDEQFKTVYDIVLMAQETAAATIEAGMRAVDAHMIAQNLISEAGYGDKFGHGLGHGVGLEIHEKPRVGRNSDDVLADGMVITVEPGIYLPGWGGVRLEDMGVIQDGKFRAFTTAPKLRFAGA